MESNRVILRVLLLLVVTILLSFCGRPEPVEVEINEATVIGTWWADLSFPGLIDIEVTTAFDKDYSGRLYATEDTSGNLDTVFWYAGSWEMTGDTLVTLSGTECAKRSNPLDSCPPIPLHVDIPEPNIWQVLIGDLKEVAASVDVEIPDVLLGATIKFEREDKSK